MAKRTGRLCRFQCGLVASHRPQRTGKMKPVGRILRSLPGQPHPQFHGFFRSEVLQRLEAQRQDKGVARIDPLGFGEFSQRFFPSILPLQVQPVRRADHQTVRSESDGVTIMRLGGFVATRRVGAGLDRGGRAHGQEQMRETRLGSPANERLGSRYTFLCGASRLRIQPAQAGRERFRCVLGGLAFGRRFFQFELLGLHEVTDRVGARADAVLHDHQVAIAQVHAQAVPGGEHPGQSPAPRKDHRRSAPARPNETGTTKRNMPVSVRARCPQGGQPLHGQLPRHIDDGPGFLRMGIASHEHLLGPLDLVPARQWQGEVHVPAYLEDGQVRRLIHSHNLRLEHIAMVRTENQRHGEDGLVAGFDKIVHAVGRRGDHRAVPKCDRDPVATVALAVLRHTHIGYENDRLWIESQAFVRGVEKPPCFPFGQDRGRSGRCLSEDVGDRGIRSMLAQQRRHRLATRDHGQVKRCDVMPAVPGIHLSTGCNQAPGRFDLPLDRRHVQRRLRQLVQIAAGVRVGPADSSTSTVPTCPSAAAVNSAVRPCAARPSTSAPAASSSRRISVRP